MREGSEQVLQWTADPDMSGDTWRDGGPDDLGDAYAIRVEYVDNDGDTQWVTIIDLPDDWTYEDIEDWIEGNYGE
jgi:hypothetical protein